MAADESWGTGTMNKIMDAAFDLGLGSTTTESLFRVAEPVRDEGFMELEDAAEKLIEYGDASPSKEINLASAVVTDHFVNNVFDGCEDTTEALVAEFGHWGEHPDHSLVDWGNAAKADDTRLGYWQWVASNLESDAEAGDDMCDNCGRSGIQISHTDGEGNTICNDCLE